MNLCIVDNLRNGPRHWINMASTRSGGGLRPRSPSHAAKNKTPEDRVCEFGWMLTQKDGRLMCRACNLNLDHTRRSTIVEHLRSRKHQRFLEESELDLVSADAATVTPIVLMEICEDENSQNNTQSSSDRRSSQSSPTPGMAGPYLLKKETHCTTILDQLLRDDTFSDVTLTAEGQSIRAHKIVLCLASAYFRQVLSKDSTVQNVIVFRDIKFSELRNLINFIYTGEATVDASDLESFMKTAEMLEVNSLSDGQRNLPKNFLPRTRDPEPERPPRGSSSSKRSHNAGPSSPPSKSRRMSADVSPPSKSHKSSYHPSMSSGVVAPSFPVLPPPVIKTEPKSEEMLLEDDYPHGRDEAEEIYDNHTKSPTQHQDPNKSPPLDRLGEHSVTEKGPPGKCPYCPGSPQVRGAVSLTKHLYLCHPDKTVFSCDICSRAFLKKGSYESHKEDCR